MKAYVINLRSAKRRRDHIIRAARAAGVEFELIEAVDGRELTDAQIEELCDLSVIRDAPNWLTRGAIGAALSHRRAYERIVESGDHGAIVLEDDVTFDTDFKNIVSTAAPHLKEREAILLNYVSFEHLDLSLQRAVPLAGERRLMYPMFLKGVMSAAAYMISRDAAMSMLSWTLPIRLTADCWFDFHQGGPINSVRCVYPMPVHVIGAKSTIESVNQSFVRARITEIIDKYQVPVFNSILTRARLRSVATRLNFGVTEEFSPLDPNGQPA